MARLFSISGTSYAYSSTSPISTIPATLACWFRRDSSPATTQNILAIDVAANDNEEIAIRISNSTPYYFQFNIRSSDTNLGGSILSGTTVGQWTHGAATFTNATTRAIYQNGSTATASLDGGTMTPTGLNCLAVGSIYRAATPSGYFDGAIAHLAIWNVALSASEVARLYNSGRGADPRSIRPDALVAYWPLINGDGDQDYKGNTHLTAVNSPTYAQHPPVLVRSRPKYVILGSSAPSIATIDISGTRQVGNTLTCNATSSPSGATFTYQWYMADDIAGTNQTAISGATSQTYELSYANIGAATKLYEGLDANGEAFIACGATPTKDAVEGDETVSSYVSITEAAVSAPAGSPFESAFIR